VYSFEQFDANIKMFYIIVNNFILTEFLDSHAGFQFVEMNALHSAIIQNYVIIYWNECVMAKKRYKCTNKPTNKQAK
jgi:hypothetical protein